MDTMQNPAPAPTPTIDPPIPTPPEEHPLHMFSQDVHPFVAWSAVLSMAYFVMMPAVTFMM